MISNVRFLASTNKVIIGFEFFADSHILGRWWVVEMK
jgi:hypothetical protein